MAADRFAQRVDDERCADRFGLEQVGRGHGAVHHIQQAALGAELADALQVRDLGARIGHGLHEDHAGFRTQRRLHVGGFCCVDQAHFAAELCQGVHPAGGVAEQVAAGHDVIAFSQQRHHGRTDRGHAGGKAHRAHGVFHQADLGFQRLGRRVALPPIDVAGTLALKHGREFLGRGVAIGRGDMQRLEHCAVLDRAQPVGVEDAGDDVFWHFGIVARLCPCHPGLDPGSMPRRGSARPWIAGQARCNGFMPVPAISIRASMPRNDRSSPQ